LVRCTVGSALLLSIGIVFRLMRVNAKLFRPFTWSVYTLGSVTYFLGVLIGAHAFRRSKSKLNFALIMVFSLIIGLLVGATLVIPPLFNSSIVFWGLWILDLLASLNIWSDPAFLWAGIFIGSFFVFQASMWMKTNPDWITTVFMF
jgi:hypothetical protein